MRRKNILYFILLIIALQGSNLSKLVPFLSAFIGVTVVLEFMNM